jgi:hypothetical protein
LVANKGGFLSLKAGLPRAKSTTSQSSVVQTGL